MKLTRKWLTRAASAALALTLTLSLSACSVKISREGDDPAGGSSPVTQTTPGAQTSPSGQTVPGLTGGDTLPTVSAAPTTVQEIMSLAQTRIDAVESMCYDMTMDMELSVMGQTLNMDMTMKVEQILSPMRMKMEMSMDMGGLGEAAGVTEMLLYAVEENGQYVMYGGEKLSDGSMRWSKQTLADMTQLQQYDAGASMELYLKNSDSFKAVGSETIHGEATTRYDGVITGEALDEVMATSGVMSQFSSMGVEGGNMAELLTGLGDLPISIWVTNSGCVPVKYEMDMTEMMQGVMKKSLAATPGAESVTMDVGRVFVTATMYNINEVREIVIPEEALRAQ